MAGNMKDFATGTVLTAPSPATSGTSLVLQSGEGARMPAAPFYATAHPATELPTLDNAEKILVTAKSTDTLTITRAQGSTTAKSIAAGWRISNAIFEKDIVQIPVTVSTAAATATKVGSTSGGGYTPETGDRLLVTFSSGMDVATPTLNIDGSGAKNIRVGNVNVTTALFSTASAVTIPMWYDGTYYQIYGSYLNTDTTYSVISEANLENTASTTGGLITGQRAEALMDNEKSIARVLTNKSIDVDNNTVTNVEVDNFKGSAVVTESEGLNSSDNDTSLPTTAAVKDYVDARAGSSWVFNETPSGTVNGSNVTFTLASTPTNLMLFLNGVYQKPGSGNDYTLSGLTITFLTAPASGSQIMASYTTGTSSVFLNGSNSFVANETPSGTINGSNATFTTSVAYIGGSLEVYVNGIRQIPTTHFTETTPASGIFTLGDAPLTGDLVSVSYQKISSVTGNADTVDGYHANATPTANTIPVLDSNGLMPNSTINYSGTPFAIANSSGTQSVTNTTGTRTGINLGTSVVARAGFTIGSNAITIPATGWYWLNANVLVTDSENFFAVITGNGTSSIISHLSFRGATSTARGYQDSTGSILVQLTAGDTIELAYENRGFATTINSARLEAMRIG